MNMADGGNEADAHRQGNRVKRVNRPAGVCEPDDSARRRLEKGGYRCHAVLDIARITRVLHRAGRLSDAETALLGHGVSKGVLASS